MSKNDSPSETLFDATDTEEPDEIGTMINQLDDAIENINDKIADGRVRDPEKEKVRLKYHRTLGYLIRTKRKLVEDKTLSELSAEVEALKEARREAADQGQDQGDEVELTLGGR